MRTSREAGRWARRAVIVAVLVLTGSLGLGGSAAQARAPSPKKAIWGPPTARAFAHYSDLGVGIYETKINWARAAPHRPARPRDPSDPAYVWPADVTQAVRRARAGHIGVAIMLSGAPGWANGGRAWRWAPRKSSDYARFAYAAARRYPGVHLWMVWGEPSRGANFQPLTPEHRSAADRAPARLSAEQQRAPRRYARLLDAAYGALKHVSAKNLVIGGDTFTTGDISVYNWLRYMRLPDGRPPRMDLYGHNPFTLRRPQLSAPPLGYGFADFSDLDTLTGWLDRLLRGRAAGPRHLKLFLSEFTAPTDHPNHEFNFWVTRKVQAQWLAAALRITRRWSRISTLGWISLSDEPRRRDGLESNHGLLDDRGHEKPSYAVYARG